MSIKNSMCSRSESAFHAMLAAIFVVAVLIGYYAIDAIGFALSADRRVTFTVARATGKVVPNSVRLNRFFGFPTELPEEIEIPEGYDGLVFSYPSNSTTCTYTIQGKAVSYTFPPKETKNGDPVPACPQLSNVKK